MKTSEHLRNIADELGSVIIDNRPPGPAPDVIIEFEHIAGRLNVPNAKLLLYRLRRDAKSYYGTNAPQAETNEADALYVDLLGSIERLRQEASAWERIGD
ncbi:hypothetical protein UB46_43135 [Burkholderiaceae bacterium 16]|nr:hypothetical protein UB46_43135 [Burkholderiaceae bacterium 16]